MYPSDSTKTYLSVSLGCGNCAEPPISNDVFLSSFLEFGCWLRVVQSRRLLSVLEDRSSTDLESMAALASFYQNAGLIVEDALTMYLAWSLWSLDKARNLADILERLNLRLSEPKKAIGPGYVVSVQKSYLENDKRLDVYPRPYLSELLQKEGGELSRALGIEWKRNPSVKLVPPVHRQFWDRLDDFIREASLPLVDSKGALLAACFNKIKHGPQLVAMAPNAAAAARGLEEGQTGTIESKPTIRLLLAGSRTQEMDEELECGARVAPFLLNDPANIRRWFFQQIVHTANSLYVTGTWIFNSTYIHAKRSHSIEREELRSIVEEQEHHNEKLSWLGHK